MQEEKRGGSYSKSTFTVMSATGQRRLIDMPRCTSVSEILDAAKGEFGQMFVDVVDETPIIGKRKKKSVPQFFQEERVEV